MRATNAETDAGLPPWWRRIARRSLSHLVPYAPAALRRHLVAYWKRAPMSDFDQRFATDTETIVPLWALDIASSDRNEGVRYEASDPTALRSALDAIEPAPEESVFVDLGSGKGRTLLIASDYPFKRVIGVEFSNELVSVARRNIATWRTAHPANATEIVTVSADAGGYQFPDEDIVVYMYNPFSDIVMTKVVDNLVAHVATRGRTVDVLYLEPVHARCFDDCPFFEPVHLDLPEDIRLRAYRSTPGMHADP